MQLIFLLFQNFHYHLCLYLFLPHLSVVHWFIRPLSIRACLIFYFFSLPTAKKTLLHSIFKVVMLRLSPALLFSIKGMNTEQRGLLFRLCAGSRDHHKAETKSTNKERLSGGTDATAAVLHFTPPERWHSI